MMDSAGRKANEMTGSIFACACNVGQLAWFLSTLMVSFDANRSFFRDRW